MKRKHRPSPPLPIMLAELAFSSWETIAYRSMMMALGSCSLAEYHRMSLEKLAAAQQSALALMSPTAETATDALAPWHRRAVSNARRLRPR